MVLYVPTLRVAATQKCLLLYPVACGVHLYNSNGNKSISSTVLATLSALGACHLTLKQVSYQVNIILRLFF